MAKGKIGVLLCLETDLETQCIQALEKLGTIQVQRRCADTVEVIAAAEAGIGQICALDAQLCEVDRDDIARIRKAGLSVVIVNSESDLGANAVSSNQIDELVGQILSVAKNVETSAEEDFYIPQTYLGGKIIAVTSPPGSTGKSSIAIALGALLAQAGQLVLFVDADTNFASLEQMLGVQSGASGLAAASRLAGADRLDPDSLRQLVVPVFPNAGLLSGLPDGNRWRELGPAALEVIWQQCRQVSPWTIIDTAAFTDKNGRDMAYGAHRDDVTYSALEAADEIVYVAEAGPVGLLRLLRTYQDDLFAEAKFVVNKVSEVTCGRHPERAVREVITHNAPNLDPVLVGYDYEIAAGATFHGQIWSPRKDGFDLAAPLRSIIGQFGVALPQPVAAKKKKL